MIVATSEAEARSHRLFKTMQNSTIGNWINDYFGKELAYKTSGGSELQTGLKSPMAYLVEQPPNYTIPAHFHLVDQFQVVVTGSGWLGKHRIVDTLIHYTNAYTTYGPIIAEQDGVEYFTLRNAWDVTGAHRMPESRDEMLKVPKRHLTLPPIRRSPADMIASLDAVRIEELKELDDTGLAVWRFQIPPATSVDARDPALGNGQFWLVLGGSLEFAGRALPSNSLVFVSNDEKPPRLTAGDEGLEILIMQFPRKRESTAPSQTSSRN